MIQSTKGKLIKQVLAGKPGKGFPSDLLRVAVRKVAMLEALAGDRKGQHSIRINDQWRVCFIWTNHGPENVEIVDYH